MTYNNEKFSGILKLCPVAFSKCRLADFVSYLHFSYIYFVWNTSFCNKLELESKCSKHTKHLNVIAPLLYQLHRRLSIYITVQVY